MGRPKELAGADAWMACRTITNHGWHHVYAPQPHNTSTDIHSALELPLHLRRRTPIPRRVRPRPPTPGSAAVRACPRSCPALALCHSADGPDAVFAPCSPSVAYPRGSLAAAPRLNHRRAERGVRRGVHPELGLHPIGRLSVLGLELPTQAARALIADIPTHREPTALSKLMISVTSPEWRMHAEDVAPLAKCTGLTSLVLYVFDVEYETFASSWSPTPPSSTSTSTRSWTSLTDHELPSVSRYCSRA
ncbi:hypothetical protein EV121DRAFT_292165 [Schizophyllum commune]